MLHAPVTDRKNKPESINSAMLAEYEQQNQSVNWSERSPKNIQVQSREIANLKTYSKNTIQQSQAYS